MKKLYLLSLFVFLIPIAYSFRVDIMPGLCNNFTYYSVNSTNSSIYNFNSTEFCALSYNNTIKVECPENNINLSCPQNVCSPITNIPQCPTIPQCPNCEPKIEVFNAKIILIISTVVLFIIVIVLGFMLLFRQKRLKPQSNSNSNPNQQ